ncbi:hypothetical protein [Cryobacterium luteum]|uniref:Uncharacterized protein n=1 Tax=Cryobacterium luteum TaxID=1424661 RepID=A0A5F0D4G9_9MICO|nr:hypothetical protein [Cryobacterium luteum]TFB89112.1 hypothetical protein E3O10_09445 [Cryobacterium luteum]
MSRGEPYAGATTPGRRPPGPMTWLGVALGGITLAALFSGGDGRAEICAELSESIPEIAGFSEVSTMADLREFNEPSADLRARFTSSGEVYRVIDSSVDRARIALWRRDVPGPGPGPYSSDPERGFSTEEIVVGTACASIERTGHKVTSTPVDCPHPLAAWSPPTEVASWTRDAAAAWVVQVSVSSLNQDVRWLLFHSSDGSQPRHELVDADAVVDVIKKARLSSADTSVRVAVGDVSQEGSRITGKVRIAAYAPEEANTTAKSASTACFILDVDLQLFDQYGSWEPLIPEELGASNCAQT